MALSLATTSGCLAGEVLLFCRVGFEVIQLAHLAVLMQFPRTIEDREVFQPDNNSLARDDLPVANRRPDVLSVQRFPGARFETGSAGQRGQQVQYSEYLAGLGSRLDNSGPLYDVRYAYTAFLGSCLAAAELLLLIASPK